MENEIIRHSTDMVTEEYIFLDKFRFQRLLRFGIWFVTYNNHIITFGQYRHDLEEWIENTYIQTKENA